MTTQRRPGVLGLSTRTSMHARRRSPLAGTTQHADIVVNPYCNVEEILTQLQPSDRYLCIYLSLSLLPQHG